MDECVKSECCPANPYDYEIDSGTPDIPPLAIFTVTLDIFPDASGTATGGGQVTGGQFDTITATSATGYQFDSWSGDFTSTANPAQVFIDNDKTITANFVLQSVGLGILPTPSIGGTVSGQGSYTYGDTATLTATPNAGYTFSGWSGDLVTTSNPATLVMDGTKSVIANFTIISYTLAITTTPTDGGGVGGAGTYSAGATANLNAIANDCHDFLSWSGDLMSTNNPENLLMDSNKNVVANFSSECIPVNVLAFLTNPSIDSGNSPGIVDVSSGFTPSRVGSSSSIRLWRFVSDNSDTIIYAGPYPVTTDGTLDLTRAQDPTEGATGFYPSDLTFRDYFPYSDGMYLQVSCECNGVPTWPDNPDIPSPPE